MTTNAKDFNFKRIMGCERSCIASTIFLTTIPQIFKAIKDASDDTWRYGQGWYDVLYQENNDPNGYTVFKLSPGSPVICDFTNYICSIKPRRLFYLGLAGTISKEINIGDLVIPTASCRGDGASYYHAPNYYPAVASFSIYAKVKGILSDLCSKQGVSNYDSITYTIDSLTAETEDLITKLSDYGIAAIDMETSAFYTMASLNNVDALAILIISDSIREDARFDKQVRSAPTAKLDAWVSSMPQLVIRLSSLE